MLLLCPLVTWVRMGGEQLHTFPVLLRGIRRPLGGRPNFSKGWRERSGVGLEDSVKVRNEFEFLPSVPNQWHRWCKVALADGAVRIAMPPWVTELD